MEHDVDISNEGDILGKLVTSDLINIEIEDPERTINELKEIIVDLKLEVQQLHNERRFLHGNCGIDNTQCFHSIAERGEVSCHLSRSRKENDRIIGGQHEIHVTIRTSKYIIFKTRRRRKQDTRLGSNLICFDHVTS